jgi:SAM-dependent methyltransferase
MLMSAALFRWDRWEKLALLTWGAALLAVCGRVLVVPKQHNTFVIYAAAGRAWLGGEDLYGRFFEGLDVFRYSPLLAGLFAPLAELPLPLASVLWRLLNGGVLFGALLCWGRDVLPGPWTPARRGLLCLLVLPLAVPSLNNGQCNCLIAGLILATVAAAARQRWNLAAAAMALASLWKVYPLAAGLLLAALYPRRLAGRLALALLVAAGLPLLMQHPAYVADQYAAWVRYLGSDERQHLPLDYWLRDVRLLFRVWARPLSDSIYLVLQVTSGLACAGLCLAAKRQRWPPRRLFTLLTGLACGWMMTVGPSVESCTFVVLAPSLTAALLRACERPGLAWKSSVLAVSYGLFVATYLAGWFPWGKAVSNLGPQPLAALLFLGCLMAEALRELRHTPSEGGLMFVAEPRADACALRESGRPLSAEVLSRYRAASLATRLFLRARWQFTPYEILAARLPARGLILDLGSGHGLFALTLALQSDHRRILAVDHDRRRVKVARQAAAGLPAVQVHAGPLEHVLAAAQPPIAGIVLLDTLHYLSATDQEAAVQRAYQLLSPEGLLLVREVDAGAGLTARIGRLHERLMTGLRLTRAGRLVFRTASAWEELLRRYGFRVRSEPCPSLCWADRLFLCRKEASARSD